MSAEDVASPDGLKLETTAEERANWAKTLQTWQQPDPVIVVIRAHALAAIRDIATLLAKVARLKAELVDTAAEEHENGWNEGFADGYEEAFELYAPRGATARAEERNNCFRLIAEQRCERDTPWDMALVAAMTAIRARSAP